MFNFKKKNLHKLILGSFFISISVILSQINKFFPIFLNKFFFVESNFFCYWYLPFFIMSLFFSFSYNLFFLFFYCFLDIFMYSGEKYLLQANFLANDYSYLVSEYQKIYLFFNMFFFGTLLPVLAYSLNCFFAFCEKKNYKKIFLFFFIIVTIQSFSRFLCGFLCYWGPKKKYYNLIFKNINSLYKTNKPYLFYYFSMFFLNFIPVFISNFILFISFFVSRNFILKNYFYLKK
ncbi:hypothetical protein [Candidatus Phytoplasma sacchari]|nr:hypothetical protein [Candidatus Phytoplasma sacchari]KAB8122796.1 hypothetical protein F2B49_00685 [Candidatus Phytoplasma sacchari]